MTTESGTGCVHTAPGHGVDDFLVGQKYGIEVYNPVGDNGVYKDDTPLFAGQHVFKANEPIVDKLREVGNLMHAESYRHSYPHCWRHKTPIIFRATPQWFISMDKKGLRAGALEQIKKSTGSLSGDKVVLSLWLKGALTGVFHVSALGVTLLPFS